MEQHDTPTNEFYWSKAQLARALGIHRNTVAALIERDSIPPAASTNKGELFELKRVAAALFGGTDDESVGFITPEGIPVKTAKDREAFFDSEIKRLKAMEIGQQTVRLEDHLDDKARVFKALVDFFTVLPAKMERDHQFPSEYVPPLIQMIDDYRNNLVVQLKAIYPEQETED